MPSAWSPATGRTAAAAATSVFAAALRVTASSVIALTLLPFASLQPEPRDQDGAQEERDHGRRDRGALAEMTAQDGALVGQRRHQLRGIDGAAPGQHPDELEVREGE